MVKDKSNDRIFKQFNIDIMNDYVLNDVNNIVFCFDWSKKEKSEISILRGKKELFNFFVEDTLYIETFMNLIEVNNPMAEVYGKDNFIDNIINDLNNLDEINELYLPVRTDSGVVWFCLTIKSLTKKNGENELLYGHVNFISNHTPRAMLYYQNKYKDFDTNLFTKASLQLHLSLARETDHSYGLFFDIDNFKRINDVFGHRAGDIYIKQLADKLILNYDSDVIYYRIGGDEFFVYLVNSTEEKAYKKALDVIYTVETLNPHGQQVEVSASIGIVPIIGNDINFDSIMELADKTMYFSKRKGKGNISYAREV